MRYTTVAQMVCPALLRRRPPPGTYRGLIAAGHLHTA